MATRIIPFPQKTPNTHAERTLKWYFLVGKQFPVIETTIKQHSRFNTGQWGPVFCLLSDPSLNRRSTG